MKILLVDNGTKHLGKLMELLSSYGDVDIYKLFSKYPDFNKFDLVVLSGGSQVSILSAPEIFRQQIDAIKSSRVPIIGICQGCEIIAIAYNSKLEYLEHKSKGIKEIKLSSSFFGNEKTIQVYEAHHLAVIDIGQDLISLAKSDDGIEILRHKTKPIFGIQFHPEMFEVKTMGDEIFDRLISMANSSV